MQPGESIKSDGIATCVLQVNRFRRLKKPIMLFTTDN